MRNDLLRRWTTEVVAVAAAITLALLMVLLLWSAAQAQDVAVLEWQHPEQYTDDAPLGLDDIAATQIEYGLCPPATAVWKVIEIDAPTEYVVNIPLPSPGLYCFRARTKDVMGAWSDWTDAVIRESPLPPYTGVTLPPFKLVTP